MDYYEELGVGRDASVEEIRHAYKTLARLLHPDGQADEKVRAMAERQMKRLHEVLAILANAEKRQEYNERLDVALKTAREHSAPGLALHHAARQEVARLDWVQVAVRHWSVVLIGTALLFTVMVWYALPREPDIVEIPPLRQVSAPPESAAPVAEPPHKLQERPSSGPPANGRHPSAVVLDIRPSEALNREIPSDLAPKTAYRQTDVKTAAASSRLEASPVPETRVEESPFAGVWLFRPQQHRKIEQGTYPALYVEFSVEERNGNIDGTFRGRYAVADRAVSPELLLLVHGESPAGKSGSVEWTSRDGAKGVLELNLLQPGQLDVAWWTTKFADQLAITSGRAELIRQVP